MEFLISPFKKKPWKIDKSLFINELKKKYPTADISEIKDDERKYCYEWKIDNDDFLNLEGSKNGNKPYIYVRLIN